MIKRLPEIKDPAIKRKLNDKKNKVQKSHAKKEHLDKPNHFFELLNKG